MTSTSRIGRPRTRSRSVHISSYTPVDPKGRKLRVASVKRTPNNGKSAGKGKKTIKKSNKAIAVVSSDSEDLEVDFPDFHPNQPHKTPEELPRQPNPSADAPAEEQQELDHPKDNPIKELD